MGDSLGVPWPLMLRAQLLSRRYPHERQLTVLSLPSSIPAPLLCRLLFLVECAVRYMANSLPVMHPQIQQQACSYAMSSQYLTVAPAFQPHCMYMRTTQSKKPFKGLAAVPHIAHCTLRLASPQKALQPPMSWLPYSTSGGGAPVAWTTSNPAKTHAAVVTSPPYFATQRAPPRRPASSGKSPRNSSRPLAAGRRRLRRDVPHRLSWRAARRCSCAW